MFRPSCNGPCHTRAVNAVELEVYAVFADPVSPAEAEAALPGLEVERYRDEAGRVRAVRFAGDAEPGAVLPLLKAGLAAGRLRWLEFGLRGYAVIEGKRERRPWRRNAYLGFAGLEALEALEPGVRYHGPA